MPLYLQCTTMDDFALVFFCYCKVNQEGNRVCKECITIHTGKKALFHRSTWFGGLKGGEHHSFENRFDKVYSLYTSAPSLK